MGRGAERAGCVCSPESGAGDHEGAAGIMGRSSLQSRGRKRHERAVMISWRLSE